jgi:hypothetical protein
VARARPAAARETSSGGEAVASHDELTRTTELSEDAGCTVDWSWLRGLEIESATSDLQHWRVRFTNGQTLTIQAADYQGRPFLAFNPYKPKS